MHNYTKNGSKIKYLIKFLDHNTDTSNLPSYKSFSGNLPFLTSIGRSAEGESSLSNEWSESETSRTITSIEEAEDSLYFEEGKENDLSLDRAQGAVLGALMGDAIGAYLEFDDDKITDERVEEAYSLPGGGIHGVGPGQVTDDGELTMCLLHAFSKKDGKLDPRLLAKYYAKWFNSDPFDIGFTCETSLSTADLDYPNPKEIKKAAKRSIDSQSNGSLMRATPIGVLWHKMSKKDIKST
jgi:hypothetical protein